MATKRAEIKVFNAWQSDSQTASNRALIRQALRAASNAVESQAGTPLRIDVQEAIRDEPGSPDVPNLILSKVESSDIFICDISTINRDAPDLFRRVPNPNVTFELGYAAAHLGWDRVVMLFNTAFGDLKNDPPFDFDRHRITHFNSVAATPKAAKAALEALLKTALQSVIVKDPPRPAELKGLTAQQIKRRRDIDNLRWILGTIHWPSLDDLFQEGPDIIRHPLFFYWEDFNAVLSSSLFHLYDTRIAKEIHALHSSWAIALSFGQQYHPNPAGDSIFADPYRPLSRARERAWNKIMAALRAMSIAEEALLKDVRRRYLEIDIDALSQAASKRHAQFEKDFERDMETD